MDVGAKAEIYRLFDVALKRGAAILLVSTDFEEVEKVCHRALVFDRGRVVAELGVGDMSAENLLAAASASIGQVAEALTRIEPIPGAAMQSLKSTALEPTRSELAGLTRWRAAVRILPVYGLPILALALAIFFSILLPDSFPTALNVRSILSDKGIIALLSLGAMLPMMAGRIDLTIGFGIVMWHILAISLQVWYHVPWPLAILLVLLCSALAGLINGLLVEVAQIDSFIATLGTGTILYALALWLSGGRQVMGILAPGFIDVNATVAARHTDAGRLCDRARRGALDHHRTAAAGAPDLCDRRQRKGRRAERHPGAANVIGVFVGSGLVAGFTGCVLASKLQIGQANVGLDYLLPALVGAFLGTTTIKPGRVNVLGTIVGVLILAIGISGIQQLGGAFFIEPLFNGATLVVAIALAGFAQRRRSVTVSKAAKPGPPAA